MPRLRAVLLDAGGTLIHPDHAFIIERIGAHGLEVDAEAYAAAERHARSVVGDLLRSDDPGDDASRAMAWFTALLTRLGLGPETMQAVGADIRARHEEGRLWVRAVPGTREMLEGLRAAGLRLAVISNADGRVARYLATAGLVDCFELIVDSAIEGIEKPDPRIFRVACERMGVAPEETVYVGDTFEVDVLGALAAGIRGILLADEPRDGVACIRTITELPGALDLVPTGGFGDDR
jgi:HAD superfamily hydrolase (TIGR01509 family)